ncbi:MAG: type II secretion system GspH family protein [Patescibacteria group bacterium]|nr:type II secretion system GspH family protein [Patescibacteria group bacterium]
MKLKAFTLFETLIVVFIVGMLSVSLLESYNLIVEISFSIEQDKNLNEESLFFQQTLQTISETATIDYDKYHNTLSGTS